MNALHTLVLILPPSVTSGINLYATVLMAGLGIRYGWWADAPAGLDVLASWPVIIIAGVLYLVEFLVEKFNFLDDVWDVNGCVRRTSGAGGSLTCWRCITWAPARRTVWCASCSLGTARRSPWP